MTTETKKYGPSSSDMEYYYRKLYPFESVFNWLNHSTIPTNDITNREFAMAFRSGAYKRYNSFNSVAEFKSAIERGNPDRFEIGAVYNKPPKDRDSLLKSEMKPLEKELVFDIDMDDYDAFRTCCSGAKVCNKCWKFISLAMKVINITLEQDFGFKDYIWVFSGRRGAHCWISDKRARILNDLQRRNILDYVNVIRDRNFDKRLALLRPYHPHLSRSLEMLKPYFVEIILEEQDPWENDQKAIQTLLSGLHDKQLIEALKKYWIDHPNRSSKEKWSDIDKIAADLKLTKRNEFVIKLRECKEDLVMSTLYPKVDVEVTKQTIHLLKAPFCIHPATGNVCVPMDFNFSPDDAPKLIDLQNEMENNNEQLSKTSLEPFLDYFNKYVNQVMDHNINDNSQEKKRKHEVL